MDGKNQEGSSHFALVGAGGYIAPRHMKAIKETGNELVAAVDPNDSVGIIDTYFPNADFFTEFEGYDRHLAKQRRQGAGLEYVSVCSPNHLHDFHVRHALEHGAHAICEKPLVLAPADIDALAGSEAASGKRIYTILQLRLHPSVRALKDAIVAGPPDTIHDIDVTYVTPRGRWYFASWKSREAESGGLVMNIGVHLFDMLGWIFGPPGGCSVHLKRQDCAAGYLEYERARVRWFLSVSSEHFSPECRATNKSTYRAVAVDGREWEFSDGFNDLHTASYKKILSGHGFRIEDTRLSIETAYRIRKTSEIALTNDYHPFCRLVRER